MINSNELMSKNRVVGYYKLHIRYLNEGLITQLKYFWIQKYLTFLTWFLTTWQKLVRTLVKKSSSLTRYIFKPL